MNDFIVFKHEIEDKEEWWGEGEWVSEPDLVEFEYKDYLCRMKRISHLEGHNKDHMFGGHLCGYVQVPSDLNLVEKDYDLDFDVHGGITFNQYIEESEDKGAYWIGFDCAHSHDYIPCMRNIYSKISDEIFPVSEEMKKSSLFNPTYKNLDYVIAECKSLVDQVIEYSKFDSSPQNRSQ